MQTSAKINILIVDDHPVVLAGLKALLTDHSFTETLHGAINGEQALQCIHQYDIDVVLLDINLPDTNGIEVAKKMIHLKPTLKIIGMSTLADYSHISRFIQSGASGYMIKNASADEIIECIETVLQGQKYFSREVQSIISSHMFTSVQVPKLTRREKEIIERIANGESNAQIAETLFLSPLTVDTHRKNLLAKFEVSNTVLLLKKAKEYGLL
jgi:DNA-binding NarL/FixJ family response regulator